MKDLNDWRATLVVSKESQIEFDGYTVSESAVDFASELAELCDKHGISRFQGGFRVRDNLRLTKNELTRDLVVDYSAVDGRGRPRRQLSVSSEATAKVTIDYELDTTD